MGKFSAAPKITENTMDFDFSDEQKFIQTEARKLLDAQCSTDLVRGIMEDDDKPFARDLWKRIAEMGWLGTAIPEAYGGLGLGYLELCVIAEELGRAVAPLPFSSSIYLFAELLKLAGSEEQKQKYLPSIASGELIGCLATSETFGDTAAASCESKVVGGKLTGRKIACLDANVADVAIVLAKNEEAATVFFVVDLAQQAVTCEAMETVDLSRSCGSLVFNGANCVQLGETSDVADGQRLLRSLYNTAAVLFAFEQVGGAEAALEMGKHYTSGRFAFGRPVASFQALKHKMADMFVAKELARSNAYYGAWALSSGAEELPVAAATARVSAIAAYDECSRENVQLHGGMGYTWEFDCHLHYRRAQLLSMNIGSGQYWRQQLSARLLEQEA